MSVAMNFPLGLLRWLIWGSVLFTALGAITLLVLWVREARSKELW